nr:bifunctional phosphoribosylaminoimidazolecarboxamide formyltransferase/IMP cyclohydrolase [Candidatus Burarchaeum sp.]
MLQVKRALITVYDKSGIADFSKELAKLGVELISTGGTASALRKAGLKVTEVSDITGFPELFEGRVKTLHPLIHGGILYKRGDKKHEAEAEKNGIRPIDLVVINLYPFEKEPGIEMIDIGGPALIRAAAKNFDHVAVVVEPSQYAPVLADLKANEGKLSAELRKRLMLHAFERTSEYDYQISKHFAKAGAEDEMFPNTLVMRFRKVQDLRYGENPHQKAAVYCNGESRKPLLACIQSLAGKQLSYNNLLDTNSALMLIRDLRSRVATAILKHNNPCGAALGKTLRESYEKALATDSMSAYGGVVAFTRKVDLATAEAMGPQFIEVVLAPGYEPAALELLKQKKSRRILDISGLMEPAEGETDFRSILGGMLYQQSDYFPIDPLNPKFNVVSKRAPSDYEKKALGFAYILAKHVKSNAIVFAREDQIVGIGAGQMSRVDACKIAIEKARDAKLEVKGTAMASDAFFPFRDTVEFAAKAGVSAIIQPGGSIRDADVIAAANEYGLAMVFTGTRHFKH